MDRIKFRAWNKADKIMHSIAFPTWNGSVEVWLNDKPQTETEFLNLNSGEEVRGCELVQFTGLLDKHGKEIYEGDILREPPKDNWDKENFSCFEVFFHSGDANDDYNIGYSMNRMHNHGSVCGGYIPSFKPKTTSKMEIIGNIYQNKELIQE